MGCMLAQGIDDCRWGVYHWVSGAEAATGRPAGWAVLRPAGGCRVRARVPGPRRAVDLGRGLVFLGVGFVGQAPASDWQKPLVDAEITLANRGLLQVDPYVSRRNLLLDEFDVAVEEL